ncbi:MAG TPA: hypothetical protein VH087_13710 [Thermoanaerobaculia bacterium]|nr:hypothetical protein [Thermoanaerobaculia bacterium]
MTILDDGAPLSHIEQAASNIRPRPPQLECLIGVCQADIAQMATEVTPAQVAAPAHAADPAVAAAEQNAMNEMQQQTFVGIGGMAAQEAAGGGVDTQASDGAGAIQSEATVDALLRARAEAFRHT